MDTTLMRLADAPLLPFEFRKFAQTVEGYLQELSKLKGAPEQLHLEAVHRELAHLRKSAEAYETRYQHSLDKTSSASADRLIAANDLLFHTERSMLLPAGLPGRDWYKHQIYAPGLYTGYGSKTLPGIREAAEAARWDEANREAEALAGVLRAVRTQIEQAEKALGRL
jgi:N-acetylated-alpha-linked acidic dipeptidase